MVGFAAARLVELEVGGLTGAASCEESPDRLGQRNGYRDLDWETRSGTAERRIPTLRRSTSRLPGSAADGRDETRGLEPPPSGNASSTKSEQ